MGTWSLFWLSPKASIQCGGSLLIDCRFEQFPLWLSPSFCRDCMSVISTSGCRLFVSLISVCGNFKFSEKNMPLLTKGKAQFPIKFTGCDTEKSSPANGTYLFKRPLLQTSCLLWLLRVSSRILEPFALVSTQREALYRKFEHLWCISLQKRPGWVQRGSTNGNLPCSCNWLITLLPAS